MRQLVLLDIRNVADQNALEYYNGAQSQADAAKDMSQTWIYNHGYPGPFPQPGSQVAILSGASTNFSSGAMMTAGYRPGDLVAAIVYDGYVWTRPTFGATLTPNNTVNGIASTRPIDTSTAVQYTLNINCPNPCPTAWPQSTLDFAVVFDFTNKPGGNLPPGMQMIRWCASDTRRGLHDPVSRAPNRFELHAAGVEQPHDHGSILDGPQRCSSICANRRDEWSIQQFWIRDNGSSRLHLAV
jgi:hypothetical protein